jgi:hypothetical protein
VGTGAGWPGVGCCTRFEGVAQEIRLVHDERPATPEAPFCLRERAQCSAAYLTCRYYSSLEHTLVRRPRSAPRDTPRETACLGSRGPRASVEISQSVSQSLPYSYQRSNGANGVPTHSDLLNVRACDGISASCCGFFSGRAQGSHFRLMFPERLQCLPFALQVDLLLQVGLPFVLRVDCCFRIVSPSLFTYLLVGADLDENGPRR